MSFALSFGTTLTSSEEFVEVHVSGLPSYGVSTSFIPEKLEKPTHVVQMIDIPEGAFLNLWVEAFFRKSGEIVKVGADVKNAVGLHIQQVAKNFVLANIHHGVAETADQCTVRCLATGDSRTGRNVCIECGTSRGTIKICC